MDTIITRYINLLMYKLGDSKIVVTEPKEGDETNDVHLLWMLKQIRYNESQSETKKHRWLGFVQGVMVSKGYLTVAEERGLTRPILNGM